MDAKQQDPNINIHDHLRYSLINSSLGLSANVAKNGKWMKPKIGKEAYSVQTVIELTKKKEVNFDINAHD